MKYVTYTLVLGLMLLSACGKDAVKPTSRSSSTAVVANACSNHAVGENFAAEDGCNTCSCRSNGAMMCSQVACVPSGSSMTMQAGVIR